MSRAVLRGSTARRCMNDPGSRRALRVVPMASASGVPVRRPTTTCLPRRAVRGVPGVHARSPGWGGRRFSSATPLADQESVPSFLLGARGHSKRPSEVHRFRHGTCSIQPTQLASNHSFRALHADREWPALPPGTAATEIASASLSSSTCSRSCRRRFLGPRYPVGCPSDVTHATPAGIKFVNFGLHRTRRPAGAPGTRHRAPRRRPARPAPRRTRPRSPWPAAATAPGPASGRAAGSARRS